MVSRRMLLKTLGIAAAPSVRIGTGSAESRCTDLCLTEYERTLAEAECLDVLGRPRSWSLVRQGFHPIPPERVINVTQNGGDGWLGRDQEQEDAYELGSRTNSLQGSLISACA